MSSKRTYKTTVITKRHCNISTIRHRSEFFMLRPREVGIIFSWRLNYSKHCTVRQNGWNFTACRHIRPYKKISFTFLMCMSWARECLLGNMRCSAFDCNRWFLDSDSDPLIGPVPPFLVESSVVKAERKSNNIPIDACWLDGRLHIPSRKIQVRSYIRPYYYVKRWSIFLRLERHRPSHYLGLMVIQKVP